MTTEADIRAMNRDQLVEHLTDRGFKCYDHELVENLRDAALEDYRCEHESEEEDEDFEPDEEAIENRRVIEHVSRVCGGLTGSEIREMMD